MIVSINQPAYLAWLGYFDRIIKSDIHVVLDSVQFEKNSFTNRNKIRTKDGWTWLTVPLLTKGNFGNLEISQLKISNNTNWQKSHWEQIKQNYCKAPYFDQHKEFFENVFSKRYTFFHEINTAIFNYLLQVLHVNTKIVYASAMTTNGVKSDLVLNLCKDLNATEYLSGPLGKNYLDEGSFISSGISLSYHNYTHPKYKQIFPNFEPYMSVIDLLFNHGGDSRDIIIGLHNDIQSE